MKRILLLLVVVFAFGASAAEVIHSAPAEFSRDAIGVKVYPAAPRLAERAAIAPAATLPAAAESVPEEIAQIRAWNDAGRLPFRNGFTRAVADPISVRLDGAIAAKDGIAAHARGIVAMSERGTLVWSGSVRVENAHLVRLHLTNVTLPDGATLWVHGAGEAPIPFDKAILHAGSMYAPAVSGPVVFLEIEIPAPKSASDGASFEIRDLVELVAFQPQPDENPACLIDATCVNTTTFAEIAAARAAIAQLLFVKDGNGAVCTGGLVNDKVTSSVIPYLLTANHCFDSQASASSLQIHFDYKTATCAGTFPSYPPAGAQLGATLLATSATSDFTFIRLNSIPAGRTLLGWTTAAVTNATTLFRVSHPFPDSFQDPAPQAYSDTNVVSSGVICSARPQTNYIYSNGQNGGTYGGSSGAPVLIANGQIVGQLFGICTVAEGDPDGCILSNKSFIDGRFSVTFPSIEQFINVTTAPSCVETATAICLNNNRFRLEATFQTASGQTGTANAVKLTSDTGYLTFFSPTNVEAVVKVLNACTFNNRYWVFAGGLTDVRTVITVTDTQTSAVKTYINPLGTPFAPIQDTSAFATCP